LFEIGSHNTAQVGLELTILPSPSPSSPTFKIPNSVYQHLRSYSNHYVCLTYFIFIYFQALSLGPDSAKCPGTSTLIEGIHESLEVRRLGKMQVTS
jgi:hypothetical protein